MKTLLEHVRGLYRSKGFKIVIGVVGFLFILFVGFMLSSEDTITDIVSNNFDGVYDSFTGESAVADMGVTKGFDGIRTNAVDEPQDINLDKKDEKLIYSSNLDLETKDMKSALDLIHNEIQEVEGIIQVENLSDLNSYDRINSYISGVPYYISSNAYIFIRIPQDKYDSFLASLKETNESLVVKNINMSVENMTDKYYDYDSRLKSLRVQENRLFKFMESAENVSDMLAVEKNLSEVQYEIEQLTNTIKTIDNDVKYTKVTLNIREVQKYTEVVENPQNFFERLLGYLKGSSYNFIESVERCIEAIIYVLPYIVIVGLIVLGIKKIRKNRKIK